MVDLYYMGHLVGPERLPVPEGNFHMKHPAAPERLLDRADNSRMAHLAEPGSHLDPAGNFHTEHLVEPARLPDPAGSCHMHLVAEVGGHTVHHLGSLGVVAVHLAFRFRHSRLEDRIHLFRRVPVHNHLCRPVLGHNHLYLEGRNHPAHSAEDRSLDRTHPVHIHLGPGMGLAGHRALSSSSVQSMGLVA